MIELQTSTEDEAEKTGLSFQYRLGSDRTLPILYLVHGRAGNKEVMKIFLRAIPKDFLGTIILPEAPIPDPDDGGFSWWLLNQEPNEDALSSFISKVEDAFGLTPVTRIGVGFSQGGMCLSLIAQHAAQLFNSLALLGSCWIPKKEALVTGLNLFLAHGENDQVVPLQKAVESSEFARQSGASVQLVTDPVGHKIGSKGLSELTKFLHLACFRTEYKPV